MANFSERIKLLRIKKNLRQIDMAEALNCTNRHYQFFEYGRSYPSFNKLIILADYFDVSLDYLVGRSDEPERR